MAEATRPSINLIQNKGNNLLTEFLNWAVNIGRLLIILTETVALATFLYRFSLDMKIVDLHDKIKAQSAIVRYSKTNEDTYRNLQARLALAKKYDDMSQKTITLFNEITTLGRGKVTFNNLSVSTDKVKIEAQASSAGALSQFIAALKDIPQISSVGIDNVQNSSSTASITVSITAMLVGSQENEPISVPTTQNANQVEQL